MWEYLIKFQMLDAFISKYEEKFNAEAALISIN